MMEFNTLAQLQWDWVESMGWHNKTNKEYLALIGSEIGEAVNECRGEDHTDKLGAELADIILRILDFSVVIGVDITDQMIENQFLTGTSDKSKLERTAAMFSFLGKALDSGSGQYTMYCLARIALEAMDMGFELGINVGQEVKAKMLINSLDGNHKNRRY